MLCLYFYYSHKILYFWPVNNPTEHYLTFHLTEYIVLPKINSHFSFDSCNASQKKWYPFVVLPFLFTLKKLFRDRLHKVVKRFKCNFVPLFMQISLNDVEHNAFGTAFYVSKSSSHSLWETASGRSITQCGFRASLNMHGCPRKSCHPESSMWFSKTSWYVSALTAHYKSTMTSVKDTDTTPDHDGSWFLDLPLVTVWMDTFGFGPESTTAISSKK